MNWMKALADCYLQVGTQYPGEPRMLVTDIDGTIIDMRYLVLSVLQSYDEARGSAYFTRLRPSDVTVHENRSSCFWNGSRYRPRSARRWWIGTSNAAGRKTQSSPSTGPFPGYFP